MSSVSVVSRAPFSARALRRSLSWLWVLALVPLTMFCDSAALAQRIGYGQWLANALVLATFVVMVRSAPPRLAAVMKYGLVLGTLGELFFSLLLGMYEYRLHNLPLYVPAGHSILYAAVYYFVREPLVARARGWLTPLLWGVGIAFAAVWLIMRHDVYGALCSAVYVSLVVKHKSSRLFFVTMFLLVAYLELWGTGFGCWAWPSVLFGKVNAVPSGNPPSGISVFYFGFDVGCLEIMGWLRPKLRARYFRLQQRRQQGAAAEAAVVSA